MTALITQILSFKKEIKLLTRIQKFKKHAEVDSLILKVTKAIKVFKNRLINLIVQLLKVSTSLSVVILGLKLD